MTFSHVIGYPLIGADRELKRAPSGAPVAACEMTKFFDTDYHYLVPELQPGQRFRLSSTRLFDQVAEAQGAGVPAPSVPWPSSATSTCRCSPPPSAPSPRPRRSAPRQEALGIDMPVHGEPERNDMVEYFGERLDGFAYPNAIRPGVYDIHSPNIPEVEPALANMVEAARGLRQRHG